MSITKNRQAEETIRRMAKAAFPDKEIARYEELTEGMCNVTYRVTFQDGFTAILKVAPADAQGTLRNEKDMMQVEVDSLRLLEEYPRVMAPKMYFADSSKTLCSGEYFFMEAMPGENFVHDVYTMADEERDPIYRELGGAIRAMAEIRGQRYGILGQESYPTMGAFFRQLFVNLLDDAEAVRQQVQLPFTKAELLVKLDGESALFDQVAAPTLVHWDLWDGNVFVKDGHMSGIIDWERTMWADPLMCDQFHTHSRKQALLEGYGQTEFTPGETRRIRWYDLLLYAIMTVETIYRQYENRDQLNWVTPLLNAAWAELTAA